MRYLLPIAFSLRRCFVQTRARRSALMRGRWQVSPLSNVEMLPLSQKNAAHGLRPPLRETACNRAPGIVYPAANENARTGESLPACLPGKKCDLGDGGHRSVRVA